VTVARTHADNVPGVDPSVDFDRVREWMDGLGLGSGGVRGVEPIGGGTQNVMLRFQRADRTYVLRRGPRHLRARSNEVLRREMTLLEKLAATDVPHPKLIAGCVDETVLAGAVFYLMEPVDGFNPSAELPRLHAESASVRHRMGLNMVDALAALGDVDYVEAGLADYGRPDGFLERQVPRWLAELESYRALEGYPSTGVPGIDRVAEWLERNRPAHWTPGVMHGDFHLANLMFSREGADVAAIVDWEMCTIGDPLLDLGWMLSIWPEDGEAADKIGTVLAAAGGLPTSAEIVARYAERSRRDLSAVTWYTVLACFKLGIVLEGTYARACAGKAPAALGEQLHAITLSLFDRAHKLLA